MKNNRGKYYEEAIEYLCNTSFNKGFPIVKIEHNVKITGRSNIKHEIDIAIEYMVFNKERMAIIECKNFSKKKVEKSDILVLHSTINDISYSHGIILSTSGFHTGALEYAKFYGIEAINMNDRKIIIESSKNYLSTVLPNDFDIAQPFYTIMERNGNENTGNYLITEKDNKRCFLLFLSKTTAFEYAQKYNHNYYVYSVSKGHLNVICNLAIRKNMKIAIYLLDLKNGITFLDGKETSELYVK
jgi:hypothetical protein